ncbi:Uncharacterised protein [[Clostridium] sordellii]|nr:Uncharacterised protein [[Clostridium] sordellii] [Paeniclostridium sordellii]
MSDTIYLLSDAYRNMSKSMKSKDIKIHPR